MKYIFLAILLSAISASAQTVLLSTNNVAKPTIVWASINVDDASSDLRNQFLKDHPDGIVPRNLLPAVASLETGAYAPVTGTVEEAVATLYAMPRTFTSQSEQLKRLAPILQDHPAIDEVPAGGLYYRLAETNGVFTLWFVRDTDLIATQLSAHDAAGDDIIHSVNLKTGLERTINLVKMTNAKQWKDMADSSSTKTNKVKVAKP